jgi:hypothetical protein
MKTYGGVKVQLHLSLIKHCTKLRDQPHALAVLSQEKDVPGSHWTGAWTSCRVGLNAVEKRTIFVGNRNRNFQSVYFYCTDWAILIPDTNNTLSPSLEFSTDLPKRFVRGYNCNQSYSRLTGRLQINHMQCYRVTSLQFCLHSVLTHCHRRCNYS